MIKPLLFFTLFFLSFSLSAQILTGLVLDSLSNEPLVGAGIFDSITKKQTSTNIHGQFQIKGEGKLNLQISYIGFKTVHQNIRIKSDSTITFYLMPINTSVQEVNIVGSLNNSNSSAVTSLNQIKINQIPSMLGESDVVKMLSTTPGVKQVEGQKGFNVRGSSQDQNLILYDEAIIYNCSHLLGMYSVFNTYAVQNVLFYKSGIPVRYGGRLASAMIVEGTVGNFEHWDNHLSIGLLASNISCSGPLIKNKISISVSARRSYIDKLILPIANTFFNKNISKFKNGYFFQDLNVKLVYKINTNNKLEVSTYTGDDAFSLNNPRNELSNFITWGNNCASIKWKHQFSEKLGMSQAFSISNNFMRYNVTQEMYNMDLKTSINTFRYKNDWFLTIKGNQLRFGTECLYHKYTPNTIDASVKEYSLDFGTSNKLQATENAIFIEYPFTIGSRFTINPGLRYSLFSQLGPYTQYLQNVVGQTTDSTLYSSLKPVKTYSTPEPRLLVNVALNEYSAIKSSVSYSVQYNHLIPIISSALPTEMWLPSMNGIKPQKAAQMSSGYFFSKEGISFSIEAYYKKLYDVSEASGVMLNFYNNGNINDIVVQGKGKAYGIEFLFEKNIGKYTFDFAYAYSRSLRYFEMLNNDLEFPAKYDKPHDLTVSGTYSISKKWSVTSLFTYSSGVNVTMPISRYFIQNNIINIYGSKNGYRMPAYHRADVSVKYTFAEKPKYKSDITFSVSNVYNHLNPYYMYYDVTGSLAQYKLKVEVQKVYLFPILPSITYTLSF